MFKYTRNPNYLGEIMVYGGFGLLVKHNWTILVLGIAWGVVFNLNMLLKDHDSLKLKVLFLLFRLDGFNMSNLQIDCFQDCLLVHL